MVSTPPRSIALLTAHTRFPWMRQTEDGHGRSLVTIYAHALRADTEALVVYDEPGPPVLTTIPASRRALVVSEPREIKRYPKAYLDQFGVILTPYPLHTDHARVVIGQPALPWWYGLRFMPDGRIAIDLDYQSLKSEGAGEKCQKISVIISKKTLTRKHRARLQFVERLAAALPGQVDVFGRGFREVADKREAIAPYKYHLVLENNDDDNFFTEKLADCLLGWALPVFSGAPNIAAYFPADALLSIDITKPDAAIDAIRALLADDSWAQRRPALAQARQLLFERYDLFRVAPTLFTARSMQEATLDIPFLLQPSHAFGLKNRLARRLKQARRFLLRQPAK